MDPSILTSDILKAAAEGDLEAALAGGEAALLEIVSVLLIGDMAEDRNAVSPLE